MVYRKSRPVRTVTTKIPCLDIRRARAELVVSFRRNKRFTQFTLGHEIENSFNYVVIYWIWCAVLIIARVIYNYYYFADITAGKMYTFRAHKLLL